MFTNKCKNKKERKTLIYLCSLCFLQDDLQIQQPILLKVVHCKHNISTTITMELVINSFVSRFVMLSLIKLIAAG